MVVTGESGSGKTEAAKCVLQFLSGPRGLVRDVIRERLVHIAPILEGQSEYIMELKRIDIKTGHFF